MVPVTEGSVTLSTDAYALATLPLLVVPAGAAVPGGITLDAPASVPAGSVVDVVWSGPANDNDFIAVARPGAPPEDWAYYALTTLGSPARLLMPGEPGDWELRYQSGSDSAIFAARPITVH
jgi:Ca-activated chloride channel family protein